MASSGGVRDWPLTLLKRTMKSGLRGESVGPVEGVRIARMMDSNLGDLSMLYSAPR